MGASPKLHPKFRGPFYVVQKNDNFTYAIHDCATNKRHPSLVHANRLRPYKSPTNRIYNAYDTVADSAKPGQQIIQQPSGPSDATQQNVPQQNVQAVDNATTTTPADPNQNDQWYPVEKLLAMRTYNKTRQYKVKWASDDMPSWQNAGDISPALIQEYHIKRTATGQKRRRRKRY